MSTTTEKIGQHAPCKSAYEKAKTQDEKETAYMTLYNAEYQSKNWAACSL